MHAVSHARLRADAVSFGARRRNGLLPPLADPVVRHVALVRLRVGLGDLLCSVPALRALRRHRPDLRVTVITWPEMAPVVDRMSAYVDELLAFPGADGIPERVPDRAGWSLFLAQARARRFDLAVQCYGDNPAANDVAAALRAQCTGGFSPAGWTPTSDADLHLPYPRHLHEVWRHLRLVEHLGVDLRDDAAAMEFPLRPADEASHEALLDRHGLTPGGYAVLHPGASSPSRRWPPRRYAAVGDALAADGLRIVLTGVAREHPLTAEVAAAMRAPALDLTGATTLAGLATLLRDTAVLVGNDTGSAHLAAAVGAPSVTLFLPGDPVRWAHPAPRHRAVRAAVGCNPCPHLDCPIDHRCATAITSQRVVSEARRAMRAGRRRSASP